MLSHHHSLFLSLPPCLARTRMGCPAQSRYVSLRKHTNAQLAPAPHEVNHYQAFSNSTASSYRRSSLVSCPLPWSVPSRSCSPSAVASEACCCRPRRRGASALGVELVEKPGKWRTSIVRRRRCARGCGVWAWATLSSNAVSARGLTRERAHGARRRRARE